MHRAYLLAWRLPVLHMQMLTLLAWCNAEAGDAEQALQCLQALRQMGEQATAAHFSLSYLSLRTLLQLGRCDPGPTLSATQHPRCIFSCPVLAAGIVPLEGFILQTLCTPA